MNTKIERFYKFIMKEKTRKFLAFAFYVSAIMFMQSESTSVLGIISSIALIIIIVLSYPVSTSLQITNKIEKNIIQEIKKIAKEILMFIPIFITSICITTFLMVGQSANQTSIEETFYQAPIIYSIIIIIIAPIIEEFIFRFLPYRFINNKILYVVISSLIFAAKHVINDPNPFYYIWFYMMRPLYYGYRYHKTKDILVPISLHSLNNLVATLLFVFS